MRWWQADSTRLTRERALLRTPWRMIERAGQMVWVGGALRGRGDGLSTPARDAELMYPPGYPARFMEVRLLPDPPEEHWAQLGTHVNADGSVCFIRAESWTPQMTARDALDLANDWLFNYWLIVEQGYWMLPWPARGTARISKPTRAALRHR